MSSGRQTGKTTHSDLKTGISSDKAEQQQLLKHEEAARVLGKKTNNQELKGSWTLRLFLSLIAATLGSFQFGYHIGCVNIPAAIIIRWYMDSHKYLFGKEVTYDEIARFQWAITVGIFSVGGMFGGLASGWFADRMGRKGAMLFNNLIAVIAAVLMTGSKYVNAYPLMIIGRIVIGIHSGLNTGLVPMYLTEISPINLRGTLGSAHQLFITIAILVSQFIGLPSVLGSVENWPLVFAFTIVPAILQLCLFSICPESPKYNLIVKKRSEQAKADLKKLRGKEDVAAEINLMEEEAAVAASMRKIGITDLFKGEYAWPMFLAIMMMCGQQLSGINVAMFFSTKIFSDAGLGEGALYATLGMGAVNVAMTLISVYLVDHPKCGRRILLLVGFIGMQIASVLLVISISIYNSDSKIYGFTAYASMVFVILFVVSFATGPGSIPWFFVSELFSSAARANASSVAVMVNWTGSFFIATSFIFINQILQQYTFLIFSAILTFFVFFVWVYVPETKGRTVEDINAEFRLGKSRFGRRQRH
ncbi:unnamed protein product [Dracunculus medinensis]|uniref:MFS domain-containing protein n=1 Tax=Dracunculus medinensis TaxID=318479 RepID=A0A0N4UK10_DRAME|nr:unnamed protein product [Dracunculus medinensis]